LLTRANPMLWPLAACSIFTLGIALERLLALRRRRVVPAEFVDRFLERLAAGKLDRDRALELCKAHESPAARIFASAVKSWGQPGATIRQNLSFDSGGELIELKRNLRVLNGMATIGPLLGLLGTVVGIIQSFDALGGRVGPARGEALAQGISLALVATAFGLVIAIFAVAAYYFLMNRVDLLVRDLDDRARQVIELISSEAIRPGGVDRRHGSLPASEPLRQETRVF
jgi:biopolymer transport protein ExbB